MVNKVITFKPRERLLKALIEDKIPKSILSLSGSVGLDYKNTYNYIKEFATSGIINQNSVGNTTLVEINLSLNSEIYSVEKKRTDEFLSKNQRLKVIKKYTEEINYPFLIVLIFGSYAKNEKTENSDVDICIISDNKDKSKELQEKLHLLSLRLEIHEFTIKEFISMIEKTQNNLGHEIIKSNIILYGIENYYNLISKWMKKE
ncbi:MAG TPA: nucleotidyltransferase domain-containing protein [Candidatus Pacearchaeota archaeon]|jgi:predicted nucleotidyltransferase|nr:nucleotidyltransferase domain-containing protein [Candidatus Pacearchaeota archaeon]HOR52091.1 nucleotidyltransferase domain-containing protein [Candidatus Pacearchaeota archaeon]HOU79369.1 nucleotidyltransferase domain-containing protein [Candidatus Pacearchaeota archaeon]HPJ87378.1 nucleotidyltransferase domain-containing protein [Candidatus Pacearchaeota archaeon]HQF83070.1 nucleotidyltransferase domain-containing protein [Candidatus Pacearchaeota archaeon]